jgi:hypothetical protein
LPEHVQNNRIVPAEPFFGSPSLSKILWQIVTSRTQLGFVPRYPFAASHFPRGPFDVSPLALNLP